MKIKLPKDLKGVVFPRILIVELNDFDIDIFLPSLFFTILAQGKGKAKITNDPKEITRYIDQLANHPDVEGFQNAEGRRVLERLIRTSLIITGNAGQGGTKGEQIVSLVPYTILTHKTGLPVSRRHRQADVFVYQTLRDYLKGDQPLRDFVKLVFGKGIEIGQLPELGGTYDGHAQLDILTRLSIAFIDGFKNTRPQLNREKRLPNAFPGLVNELAKDLLRYLFEFHSKMPTQAFTYNLLALINFELFNYTLHVVHAINELVASPEVLPAAMQDDKHLSALQMYVDFTNGSTPRSLEMSKACVRRDIETYQQFLYSNLLLRQLDIYISKLRNNPRRKVEVEKIIPPDSSGAQYLQGLLLLQEDPRINVHLEAAAQLDEERIRTENMEKEEGENSESLQVLDSIANTGETDLERIINLLAEAQRGDALAHFIQWFYGSGGLKKPHGVLRGLTTHRQTWRYAPENDLLAALVQVATARLSGPNQLRPIKLREFLDFLKERYGILVDTPPAPFEGAEYAAAARDNLRAMLGRLRQMGIFRDLSDDFTVQRLHAPYAGTEHVKVEA
ncbi:methylation-associated defense system protein MAD7 [Dictyobacter formicarum]|uniref:DUF3987 domain-containing protein n=1 Tax=Dictyobacter formicarum TaxID=2778368 RepID=A0ABQ3V824_9CHLR|nr:hypothetical protein [Dictyobacter formicarum]GHO82265.1 hypothetical protein KSZ_02710 [Dictyobacter formicarum]